MESDIAHAPDNLVLAAPAQAAPEQNEALAKWPTFSKWNNKCKS